MLPLLECETVGRASPSVPILAEVVAPVPELAVEDSQQLRFPSGDLLRAPRAGGAGLQRLAVHLRDGGDVALRASSALQFEHGDTRLQQLIDHTNGADIFGRHDILVINIHLKARINIRDAVTSAAKLETVPSVSGVVVCCQTHAAFAGNADAKGPVGENLDAHGFAGRPADLLLANGVDDMADTAERQLARQHHHICISGKKAHGRHIADIGLHADVHLQPQLARVGDHRKVCGNHGIHPRRLGALQ